MGLLKMLILCCIFVFALTSCPTKEDGQFHFPTSELPSVGPGLWTLKLTLDKSVLLAFSTLGAGYGLEANNVVYDGTYFVVPALTATNTIKFWLLNGSSLESVTTYDAQATGASQIFSATSNGAGNIYVLYSNSAGTIFISSWPTVNPTAPLSTFVFDLTTYGCTTGSYNYKIAFTGGVFYGACMSASAPSGRLRLFSFATNGSLISAVTVGWSSQAIGFPKGLTILNGNLIVSADTLEQPGGVGFFKYGTSFQYLGKIPDSTGRFDSKYSSLGSVTTDGTNLIIGNGSESCSGYSVCYRVTRFGLTSIMSTVKYLGN